MVRSRSPPPYSERVWGLSPARGRWHENKRNKKHASSPDVRSTTSVVSEDEDPRGRSKRNSRYTGASSAKEAPSSGQDIVLPVVFDDSDRTPKRPTRTRKAEASTSRRPRSRSRHVAEDKDTSRKRVRSLSRPRIDPRVDLASDLVTTLNAAFGHGAASKPPPLKRQKRDMSRTRYVETSDKDEEELQIIEPPFRATSAKSRTREREMSPEILMLDGSSSTRASCSFERNPSSSWLDPQKSAKDARGQRLQNNKRYFVGRPPPSPLSLPAAQVSHPKPLAPMTSYAARLVPGPSTVANSSKPRGQTQAVGPPKHARNKASIPFREESISSFDSGNSRSAVAGPSTQHQRPVPEPIASKCTSSVVSGRPLEPPKRKPDPTTEKQSATNDNKEVIELSDSGDQGARPRASRHHSGEHPTSIRGRPVGPPKRDKTAKIAAQPRSDSISGFESDHPIGPLSNAKVLTSAAKPVVSRLPTGPPAKLKKAKGKEKERSQPSGSGMVAHRQSKPDRERSVTPADEADFVTVDRVQYVHSYSICPKTHRAIGPDIIPIVLDDPLPTVPRAKTSGRPRGRPRKNAAPARAGPSYDIPSLPRSATTLPVVPQAVQSAGSALNGLATSKQLDPNGTSTRAVPNTIDAGAEGSDWYLDIATLQWKRKEPLVPLAVKAAPPAPSITEPSLAATSSSRTLATLPSNSVTDPRSVTKDHLASVTRFIVVQPQLQGARVHGGSGPTPQAQSGPPSQGTFQIVDLHNGNGEPQGAKWGTPTNTASGSASTTSIVPNLPTVDVLAPTTQGVSPLNGTDVNSNKPTTAGASVDRPKLPRKTTARMGITPHYSPFVTPLAEFQWRDTLCRAISAELLQARAIPRRPMFGGLLKELADPKSDMVLLLHEIAADISQKAGTVSYGIDATSELYRGARCITVTVQIVHED
ncbi:hypothetical protein EIP86_003023 [Pleurotus ostreatoroseus]|nr:hypothetical protein EIP86_003023 [Pleurotus ostreatoroseus]